MTCNPADAPVQDGARSVVTVIETRLQGKRAIHFCSHPVLSGTNNDLWFPVDNDVALFPVTEHIMVMNNVAVNVVRAELLSVKDDCSDWRIVYNQRGAGQQR